MARRIGLLQPAFVYRRREKARRESHGFFALSCFSGCASWTVRTLFRYKKIRAFPFGVGATDTTPLQMTLSDNGDVYNVSNLHAKIFIFDSLAVRSLAMKTLQTNSSH